LIFGIEIESFEIHYGEEEEARKNGDIYFLIRELAT
jgi:hypothetical protein